MPYKTKEQFLSNDEESDSSDVEVEFDRQYTVPLKTRIRSAQNMTEIERVRDRLNEQPRMYNFPNSPDGRYVLLFSGVNYLPSYFSNRDRRNSTYYERITGKDILSEAIMRNAGLQKSDIGLYRSGELEEEIVEETAKLTKRFMDFLYKRTDLKPKINSKYVYQSLLFAFSQINTDIYEKVGLLADKIVLYLRGNQKKLKISREEITIINKAFVDFEGENEALKPQKIMFVSTSFREKIGVQYALWNFDEPEVRDEAYKPFDPEYDRNGKPQHRHGGEVDIIAVPLSVYLEEMAKLGSISRNVQVGNLPTYQGQVGNVAPKFVDILVSKIRGTLNPDTRIVEQSELAFLNKVDREYVLDSFPIYYPNFDREYDERYFQNYYGLDRKSFNDIKKGFASEDKNERAKTLKELKNILQEHFIGRIEEAVQKITSHSVAENGDIVHAISVLPKIESEGNIADNPVAIRRSTIADRKPRGFVEREEKKYANGLGANISINTSRGETITVGTTRRTAGSLKM